MTSNTVAVLKFPRRGVISMEYPTRILGELAGVAQVETENLRPRLPVGRTSRYRFDYLLGAGNGDSPSSFRNALCFAVVS